jgi:hypothetical protein
MAQITRAIFCITVLFLLGCAARMSTYSNDPSNTLSNRTSTALCVPLDSLHVDYVDNTTAVPDSFFSDSFLVHAADAMLAFEAAKNFRLRKTQGDAPDSAGVFRRMRYSPLSHDTADFQAVSDRIQSLAEKYNATLVVVPYSAEIKQVTIKPAGWRNDRFGPGYERPTTSTAKVNFHVQIWDRKGNLLYERIASGEVGKPFLYSAFKREKNPDKDIVKYAKRLYAPPVVKALYNAIKTAMMVGM